MRRTRQFRFVEPEQNTWSAQTFLCAFRLLLLRWVLGSEETRWVLVPHRPRAGPVSWTAPRRRLPPRAQCGRPLLHGGVTLLLPQVELWGLSVRGGLTLPPEPFPLGPACLVGEGSASLDLLMYTHSVYVCAHFWKKIYRFIKNSSALQRSLRLQKVSSHVCEEGRHWQGSLPPVSPRGGTEVCSPTSGTWCCRRRVRLVALRSLSRRCFCSTDALEEGGNTDPPCFLLSPDLLR